MLCFDRGRVPAIHRRTNRRGRHWQANEAQHHDGGTGVWGTKEASCLRAMNPAGRRRTHGCPTNPRDDTGAGQFGCGHVPFSVTCRPLRGKKCPGTPYWYIRTSPPPGGHCMRTEFFVSASFPLPFFIEGYFLVVNIVILTLFGGGSFGGKGALFGGT